MPFTGAHPAVILPLARTAVPLSALAIGSMVPDLPFYAPTPYSVRLSHRFLGVITVDLAAGLVLVVVWLLVLRPFAAIYLPQVGVRRLHRPPQARPGWIVGGLLIGSLTHVVWDAFTHGDGWGVGLVPVLDDRIGALPAYEWMQYLSGVSGLATIGWWLHRRGRTGTGPVDTSEPEPPRPSPSRAIAIAVVALVGVAGGACGFTYGLGRPDPIRSAFFYAATWGIDFSIVGLLGVSLLHRTWRR